MKITLKWTKSEDEPGLHVGSLMAGEPGNVAAQIALVKANAEGKSFLTRAVEAESGLRQAQERSLDQALLNPYFRIEFEKGAR